MRLSAPHRMRSSAPQATPPATSSPAPQPTNRSVLLMVDTTKGTPADMDTRSPARVCPPSPARAFLFRSQSRAVHQFPRNPVSLFLNRAVPLSLYRHLPRWPSRCVVGE